MLCASISYPLEYRSDFPPQQSLFFRDLIRIDDDIILGFFFVTLLTIRSENGHLLLQTLHSRPLLQSATEGEHRMVNLSGVMQQLKKERDRVQQQLAGLNTALEAFAGVYRANNGTGPRRKMSAKGRARIAAAQRARWAKVNGQKKVVPIAKPKRTMSASARRKIAAAQRKRWAKVRA
jgi:hypothetical protein